MLTYEGKLEQFVIRPPGRSRLYGQRVIAYLQIGVNQLQGLYASDGIVAAMQPGKGAKLAVHSAVIPGKLILAVEHEDGQGAKIDRAAANRYLGVHLAIWVLLAAVGVSLTGSWTTIALVGLFGAGDAFMILRDFGKIRPA